MRYLMAAKREVGTTTFRVDPKVFRLESSDEMAYWFMFSLKLQTCGFVQWRLQY